MRVARRSNLADSSAPNGDSGGALLVQWRATFDRSAQQRSTRLDVATACLVSGCQLPTVVVSWIPPIFKTVRAAWDATGWVGAIPMRFRHSFSSGESHGSRCSQRPPVGGRCSERFPGAVVAWLAALADGTAWPCGWRALAYGSIAQERFPCASAISWRLTGSPIAVTVR